MVYDLPVLLRPPAGVDLADGDVVELGLSVDRRPSSSPSRPVRIRFSSIQTRERGKQPNYVIGGMDIAASALSVDQLLQRDCPILPRPR